MTKHDQDDPELAVALMRYELIARYLALDPPRGSKRKVLKQIAAGSYTDPNGQPLRVKADTCYVASPMAKLSRTGCVLDGAGLVDARRTG